tara:strand:+ start:109 stop:405 length:297 start_codon:yes stop_codon:yes gene_type:complete
MPGILTALKNIFTKGSKASKVNKSKGYPFKGSLDANFQDYAKKHLLNKKGFFEGGYQGNKTGSKFSKEVKKNNPNVEQLKLNLKTGGSIGAIGPNGVL